MHEILPLVLLTSYTPRLTLSDRAADALSTLPRVQVLALHALDSLWALLHHLGTLGEDELDVAWVGPEYLSVFL